MKKALIDASSAILLANANIFLKIADFYDLRMVTHVYRELTRKKDRPHAHLFSESLTENRIKLIPAIDIPESLPGEDLRLTRLHCGEKQTLYRYFMGNEDFVIIDDGKGAGYCRDNGIPYLNALLCPKILYFAGLINTRIYHRTTAHLIKTGRYAVWVRHTAEKLSADDLSYFLYGIQKN